MMVLDLQPFYIVESVGFNELFKLVPNSFVQAFREANSLALPPTAQWGSEEPLELNSRAR